jgi:hypothetical protein
MSKLKLNSPATDKKKYNAREGRMSSNVEDRRGFNNMGTKTTEDFLFDKRPVNQWADNQENTRAQVNGYISKKVDEDWSEYSKTMRKE